MAAHVAVDIDTCDVGSAMSEDNDADGGATALMLRLAPTTAVPGEPVVPIVSGRSRGTNINA